MIYAVRPLYRSGDGFAMGTARGSPPLKYSLKAKAGYAVGGISAVHGLHFSGMSVTFMKAVDGKLDPSDSYESEWIGGKEKNETTKLGGDGTPVIGIVGKMGRKDVTGLGLLFKGQEDYAPPKK